MALKKASKQKVVKVTQEKRKRPRDFEGLVAQLNEGDRTQRRWAARDLAQYGEKAIDPLCDRLEKEKDTSVQDAILSSLMEIKRPPIGERLIPLLKSDDAALRNKVIEALQAMPDLVADRINELLKDPDPDTRIFAINIIQWLKHPDVPKWLIEVIRNDDHINVVGTALDAISDIATEDMEEDLVAVKKKFNDPYIDFTVDNILASIKE